jgi:hypothetical protein
MSIPKTREELLEQLEPVWEKLDGELESAGPEIGGLHCVDEWSVKDLLAVRVWWTGSVIDWIEAWRRGESPLLPENGYEWRETPRLNADIVEHAKDRSYAEIVNSLRKNYIRIIQTIDGLSDEELTATGHFESAGKYPVVRWISINTTRQYVTARKYIRKAVRGKGRGGNPG